MSSTTSTDRVRLKPDAAYDRKGDAIRQSPARAARGADAGLEPWQFFVLAALGCASAAMFLSRGQGLAGVALLTILMAAAGLVGLAALRTLKPLVSPDEDRTSMVGRRTRVALEREKMLTLRAIKDLEFDRAMGKLSETDWQEMSGRLRARAARLIRQLDAGADYRDQIERALSARLESAGVSVEAAVRACPSCATANDADARFCKGCGQKL